MGQQVAVLVVLTQAVGAGGIVLVPVDSGAVQSPVEVAEGDLPALVNGVLDGVYIILDGLVHALHTAGDPQVLPHEPGLILVA